ncbi:poly(A) polymerase [Candidatus Photodesmus blepharus]|uniref:Poly(A) polymerase I n=1 Tax=Candidatus Photodesmus blepharonis TaxID=1179155 RepID=A0A084CN47_9GAMM|nr:polynucleotide adenylyltransferase PcnB [Candidatus Photodesmus blepharus]KEY91226.1 poly(A) polymerase [Candidatus Photodesmus blepharus]
MNIITHKKHNISFKKISKNALKVLCRLQKAGFEVYFVGGGVRDLLLERIPKDFDVTTNATPEQIKRLFKNCRLIGRRFRLAHVVFGRDVVEVATFRGYHRKPAKSVFAQSKKGILLRDNVYGTVNQDAERRDFTINAMYYSINDYSIYDYVGGIGDLEDKLIRLIGDPKTRYREDPVRILRAIRFAAKLNFNIEKDTAEPIEELGHLLQDVSASRLYEELLKLFQSGYGLKTCRLMRKYNLFQHLFPTISEDCANKDYSSFSERMLDSVLGSTDLRVKKGQKINPAFIFVAMLWYPLNVLSARLVRERSLNHYDAFMQASNIILNKQIKTIAIPRRHIATIREIWQLQFHLPIRSGRRAFRLMKLNKFRAGFDFLEMRAEIEGKEIERLSKWWTIFQNVGFSMRQTMVEKLDDPDSRA